MTKRTLSRPIFLAEGMEDRGSEDCCVMNQSTLVLGDINQTGQKSTDRRYFCQIHVLCTYADSEFDFAIS